jgi:hypothetical protein
MNIEIYVVYMERKESGKNLKNSFFPKLFFRQKNKSLSIKLFMYMLHAHKRESSVKTLENQFLTFYCEFLYQ